MDFRQLAARRRLSGLCGALLLCASLAFALDGMVAGGRKDPRLYDLTPGETLALSDPMPRGAENLAALDLRSSSPRLGVRLIESFSGFWLGGTLWRAEVKLPADLPQGEYEISMHYQNGTEAAPRQAFRLRVHKDAAGVREAALSLVTRHTGLSPYLLAVAMLPLALLPMAASYALSRRIAAALRQANMAEVFRAMAGAEGQRIFFTQAGGEPLPLGAPVEILDESGNRRLGLALVAAVRAGDVEAVMQDGGHVRPGVLARPE